ncbi:MAG: hypothetical protein Q8M19_06905 [Reyranella sp.]|nr:hypothetical protein [Reyranella sp.]
MMAASTKKIRIGEVGAAIGTTPKALRHWISRYGERGVGPTAEQTGEWLEFSWGDVAALAITHYLVNLGMPAFASFAVAMEIVKKRWPDLFNADEPKWKTETSNSMMFLYLNRDGNWGFGSFEKFSSVSVEPDSRALVTLAVAPIVLDAFEALEEMGHTKPQRDNGEKKN